MNVDNQEDAIQQDVSDTDQIDQEVAQTERPMSARERMMESIGASRLAQVEEETGLSLSTPNADDDDDGQQQGTDLDSQLTKQAGDSGQKLLDATDGLMVRVKIDGEEQEVELSKVLSQYQKGSAADKRLEEATRLLKEAQQQRGSPAPAAAVSDSQADMQTQAPAGDEDMVGKVKKALSSLYEGDEDAAAQALANLIGQSKGGVQPTQQQPDIGQLTNAVTQRLEVDSAFAKIQTDYPELLTNPDLDTLTTMKARAKEAEGVPRAKAMIDAASEVYKLIGKQPAGRQQPDAAQTTRDGKLAKKANLDEVRRANASATSSMQDDQADNPSAIIAAMAASRLGQSLPRQR